MSLIPFLLAINLAESILCLIKFLVNSIACNLIIGSEFLNKDNKLSTSTCYITFSAKNLLLDAI